jgi:hypothetical protein
MPAVQFSYGENGAVSEVRGHTGIFLPSGLDGFKVNEPAKDLLEKIGPALLASGTEELRVFNINRKAPIVRRDSPERSVRLDQYIRGREVQGAAVNITLNIQTNEITAIETNFLPDRGLQHEPKLTAAQARAKVEAAMRDSGLEEKRKIIFEDSPARLAYAFEDFVDGRSIGGVLVWVFQATRSGESVDVVVNSLTGEVVRVRSFATGFYFPTRLSYTAGGKWPPPPIASWPGGLVFTFGEGGTPPDQVAADLHNTAGTAFDVYAQVFDRLESVGSYGWKPPLRPNK